MCFRPSGETTMTAAGDTATVSGDRRSHLTLVSVIREIGRPSYPRICAPELVIMANIVAIFMLITNLPVSSGLAEDQHESNELAEPVSETTAN